MYVTTQLMVSSQNGNRNCSTSLNLIDSSSLFSSFFFIYPVFLSSILSRMVMPMPLSTEKQQIKKPNKKAVCMLEKRGIVLELKTEPRREKLMFRPNAKFSSFPLNQLAVIED